METCSLDSLDHLDNTAFSLPHPLHGTQDVRRLNILGPWLCLVKVCHIHAWSSCVSHRHRRPLGWFTRFSSPDRRSFDPSPVKPCYAWPMASECIRQLFVRHLMGSVGPRGSTCLLEEVDLKMVMSPLKTSTIPRPRTPDQSPFLSPFSPARPTLRPWRTTLSRRTMLSRSAANLPTVSTMKSARPLQAPLQPVQALLRSHPSPLAFGDTLRNLVTYQNGNSARTSFPERLSTTALVSAHHAVS